MNSLKVGDKVKVIQKVGTVVHGASVGDRGEVIGYSTSEPDTRVYVEFPGRYHQYIDNIDLQLIVEPTDLVSLPDLQLANLLGDTIREIENRAYLVGYNEGYAAAEAERKSKEAEATPFIDEIIAWNNHELREEAPEPAENFFDGLFADEPTEQDIRDSIIEQAKEDVARLSRIERTLSVKNLKGRMESFFPGQYDYVDFVVDHEKRTVVALLKYINGSEKNRAWAKGIAKCDPTDVFNEQIGKAIALHRALGLDVPAEYLMAPEPTEFRAGDVIESTYSMSTTKYVRTIAEISGETVKYTSGGFDYLKTLQEKARILDDSKTKIIERGLI